MKTNSTCRTIYDAHMQQIDELLCSISQSLEAAGVISQAIGQSQDSDFDLAIRPALWAAHHHLDKLHDLIFQPEVDLAH